jgi:hypothetical protein
MARIVKEWAVVVNGKVKTCAVADREFFDLPSSYDGSIKSKFGNDFILVDLSEYPGQNPAEGWDWDGEKFSLQSEVIVDIVVEGTSEVVE